MDTCSDYSLHTFFFLLFHINLHLNSIYKLVQHWLLSSRLSGQFLARKSCKLSWCCFEKSGYARLMSYPLLNVSNNTFQQRLCLTCWMPCKSPVENIYVIKPKKCHKRQTDRTWRPRHRILLTGMGSLRASVMTSIWTETGNEARCLNHCERMSLQLCHGDWCFSFEIPIRSALAPTWLCNPLSCHKAL